MNCTGLGARHLAGDPSVTPVAGQVVVVEQFGLERWWLDPAGPTYVVPREHEVVVGGTERHGEWSRTPSADTAAAILDRAAALVPAWGRHACCATRSGCARRGPRSGWSGPATSSTATATAVGRHAVWGCADDVVGLVG